MISQIWNKKTKWSIIWDEVVNRGGKVDLTQYLFSIYMLMEAAQGCLESKHNVRKSIAVHNYEKRIWFYESYLVVVSILIQVEQDIHEMDWSCTGITKVS
jgi:hypothetical protein